MSLLFKVHEFRLNGTHYVLLPKLNEVQQKVIVTSLSKISSVSNSSGLISAKLGSGVVHIDPAGLCWSRVDPADFIVTLMPEILSIPKEAIGAQELEEKYFKIIRSGESTRIRLSVRLESNLVWRVLRTSGGCALAPDEYEVANNLLGESRGTHRMLTDYRESESKTVMIGKNYFFESNLESPSIAKTLRTAGSKTARNSYIPRDGLFDFEGNLDGMRRKIGGILNDLGEWCFFSSN